MTERRERGERLTLLALLFGSIVEYWSQRSILVPKKYTGPMEICWSHGSILVPWKYTGPKKYTGPIENVKRAALDKVDNETMGPGLFFFTTGIAWSHGNMLVPSGSLAGKLVH